MNPCGRQVTIFSFPSTSILSSIGHGLKGNHSTLRRSRGFLLAELLPALFLSVVIFGSLCTIFVAMNKNISYQDHAQRARQTLEGSMYRILGDLRVAGCNPWGISSLTGFDPDPDADGRGNDVLLRFDRRGEETGSLPDGDIDDPDEQVLYEWDPVDRVLRRNRQPVAVDIVENPDHTPIFDWVKIGKLFLVTVTLSVRPVNEGKTFTLSTKVWLRNPI